MSTFFQILMHALLVFHLSAYGYNIARQYVGIPSIVEKAVLPYLMSIYGASTYAYFSTNTGHSMALSVKVISGTSTLKEFWSLDYSQAKLPLTYIRSQSYTNRLQVDRASQLGLLNALVSYHCQQPKADIIRISRTFQRTVSVEELRRGVVPDALDTFSYPETLIEKSCRA